MTTSNSSEKWATGNTRFLRAPDEGKGEGFPNAQPEAPPQQPPPPQQQAQPPAPQPPPQQGDDDGFKRQGRNRIVPEDAFKRIKQEAEARGARRAQEALAKEMGYPSVEAMKAARQQPQRAQPQAQSDDDGGEPQQTQPQRPQQQGQPGSRSERRDQSKWERERDRLIREKDALARRMTQEARGRKALQAALDAKDAEMSLREVAVSKGVRDVDYAVRLLTRHLEGQDESALAAFDEAQYFEGLRATHPYLFGEVVRPATTGTGTGNAPPPPKPGGAAQAQSQGNQIDAKKMSREEYQEHLRKRGLSVGM